MPGFQLEKHPIPGGYQIFEERLELAGVQFHKEAAEVFATAQNQWLELERDPTNSHDKNAIKVIGCVKVGYGSSRLFIGYVPKKVARAIVQKGLYDAVKPRLLKAYVSPAGFVEILFQLLGPKAAKKEYSGGRRSQA